MAYDVDLAERIRARMATEPGVSEMKMFGGLAFLVNGNMAVAASGQGGMLLRCDPAETGDLAEAPGAGRFVMRGKEMDGWLRVEEPADDGEFDAWVQRGIAYARSLRPKS